MRVHIVHPVVLLRAEGLVVLAFAVGLYGQLDGGWLLFVALFLVPDITFLGYLAGPRVGAAAYNTLHTYVLPLALFGGGFATEHVTLMSLALIWTAHVGADRVLGFGLKYAEGFQHTHLHRAR